MSSLPQSSLPQINIYIYISIFSNSIIQRFKYNTKTKRGGKNRRTPEKNNHPEREDVHNI
jgi:hypothetical protein